MHPRPHTPRAALPINARNVSFIGRVWQVFLDANPARLAASLAYYALFALAPLLVIGLTVANFFLGDAYVSQAVYGTVAEYLGADGSNLLSDVSTALTRPQESFVAFLIGVAVIFFASGGVFAELEDGMRTMWGIDVRTGVHGFVKGRLVAFIVVLVSVILFVLLLTVSSVLSGVGAAYLANAPLLLNLLSFADHAVTIIFSIGVFALMYHHLPGVPVRVRNALIGGAVAGVLFTIGKSAFTYILVLYPTIEVYGKASALLALLLFVYYTGFLVYWGAAFTRVLDDPSA